MLLLDKSPAEIWRMLLPKKCILYPENNHYDELIFWYRKHVYFVHEDGAVVRIQKPSQVKKLSADDLWEILFHEKDTFDYEDHGIFSIGAILLHMGYLVPILVRGNHDDYGVEIVNILEPEKVAQHLNLQNVSFQYALYLSLLKCHELNEESKGRYEFEIQRISPVDYPLDKIEPS
jgi:hypothetical protein